METRPGGSSDEIPVCKYSHPHLAQNTATASQAFGYNAAAAPEMGCSQPSLARMLADRTDMEHETPVLQRAASYHGGTTHTLSHAPAAAYPFPMPTLQQQYFGQRQPGFQPGSVMPLFPITMPEPVQVLEEAMSTEGAAEKIDQWTREYMENRKQASQFYLPQLGMMIIQEFRKQERKGRSSLHSDRTPSDVKKMENLFKTMGEKLNKWVPVHGRCMYIDLAQSPEKQKQYAYSVLLLLPVADNSYLEDVLTNIRHDPKLLSSTYPLDVSLAALDYFCKRQLIKHSNGRVSTDDHQLIATMYRSINSQIGSLRELYDLHPRLLYNVTMDSAQ